MLFLLSKEFSSTCDYVYDKVMMLADPLEMNIAGQDHLSGYKTTVYASNHRFYWTKSENVILEKNRIQKSVVYDSPKGQNQ